MKAPLSWLKEFVPLRVGAEDAAHRLTFAGLEVEGIEDVEGEKVLEVNVTANRGDCLSVRGLARELAALYGLKLKEGTKKKILLPRNDSTLKRPARVTNASACPRYGLAVIDGVKIGPSPDWIVKRLAQVGIRSVNNVVDVTNYVMMETGHPLHAFDRAKVQGGVIIVRAARDKEKILTLDGRTHELVSGDLVIADQEGPIALAGVMGGKGTEVGEGTKSIALECAFFEPLVVRRTARRLGIQTESSYRFERRVDPEGIPAALQRAIELTLELAGGGLAGPVIDLKAGFKRPKKVAFRPSEVASVLGGAWDEVLIRRTLERLSFDVKKRGADRWDVQAPSFRGDVERSIDLIEEVARVHGFDRIPSEFPALKSAPTTTDRRLQREKAARRLLADLGLQEVVHFSFVSPADVEGFAAGPSLHNPLNQDYSVMRPTLIPSLLKTASYHHRHRIFDVRMFELRRTFATGPTGVREAMVLSGLLTGRRLFSHWSSRPEETDFYDMKGIVERVIGLHSTRAGTFEGSAIPFLHPQKQAAVKVDGRALGVLGEIHPSLVDRFDLKKTAWVFELEWDTLEECSGAKRGFEDFGRFPIVERDLALILDDGIPAGAVSQLLRGVDASIRDVRVFDLYRGNQVPAGKKSLAFSILIGRNDRTMTDDEVNDIFSRLVEGARNNFQAEVR